MSCSFICRWPVKGFQVTRNYGSGNGNRIKTLSETYDVRSILVDDHMGQNKLRYLDIGTDNSKPPLVYFSWHITDHQHFHPAYQTNCKDQTVDNTRVTMPGRY